jgi:hypothetical protein
VVLRFAHHLIQCFRHGLRLIKRSKGLALGVVISMGLGVGATASIFSLVDFIMFRPLSVPETDRVVHIRNSTPGSSEKRDEPQKIKQMSRSIRIETPLSS